MSKRAYFILGPESSGNRYVTECFIRAGCYGDKHHRQRLDVSFSGATDTVVFRRSLPHGAGFAWPNLNFQLERFQRNGYNDVKALALLRNQFCTIQSHIHGNKNGQDKHSSTAAAAEKKIVGAMLRISSFITEQQLPFYFMTYESLSHPRSAIGLAL